VVKNGRGRVAVEWPQRGRLYGRLLPAGSRVFLFEAPDRHDIRLGGLVQGPVAGFEWIFHNRAVTRAAGGVTPLYFGHRSGELL